MKEEETEEAVAAVAQQTRTLAPPAPEPNSIWESAQGDGRTRTRRRALGVASHSHSEEEVRFVVHESLDESGGSRKLQVTPLHLWNDEVRAAAPVEHEEGEDEGEGALTSEFRG